MKYEIISVSCFESQNRFRDLQHLNVIKTIPLIYLLIPYEFQFILLLPGLVEIYVYICGVSVAY